MLTKQRKVIQEEQLHTLRQAAKQGWTDITAGRYFDVAEDQMEDFVRQLGQAADTTKVR